MTTDHEPRSDPTAGQHDGEPHDATGDRLNWLRAAVLGANDGIVSVAGIVMGVAGATSNVHDLFLAGMAGLVAGALSMAAGEYVSVSAQRDTEKALLAKERRELAEDPDDELAELAGIYRDKGLTEDLAWQVARQLTERDAFRAHAEAEIGIDPDELTNPWRAAFASMAAFTVGALLPLLMVTLMPAAVRVPVTVGAVVIALGLTGWVSASFGGTNRLRAVVRNVVGGVAAMAITYLIGHLVGGPTAS